MQIEMIEALIAKLDKFIKEKKVEHPTVGLCTNLNFPTQSDELPPMFRSWDKFSGSVGYPIPSSNPNLTSFNYYMNRENLYVGEQLNLRISFAKHMRKKLKLFKSKIEPFKETK